MLWTTIIDFIIFSIFRIEKKYFKSSSTLGLNMAELITSNFDKCTNNYMQINTKLIEMRQRNLLLTHFHS